MNPSRRDLLAAFLGAPLALQACRSAAPVGPLEGGFVGQSVATGHRIRDGFRPDPPAGAGREIDVVIVGGGAAGLSAGWRLIRAGHTDFVTLELEAEAGGTSRSGRNHVSAYPWGAHYLPLPSPDNRALVLLLREMGVLQGFDDHGQPQVGEEHLVRAPEERLFWHGQWWEGLYPRAGSTPEDARQLKAFLQEVDRWVIWRDAKGRRAFTIPTARCSDDPEATALDQLSMQGFLDARRLTSSRLRWFIDYSCRDDYGTTLATTSAWAGLFYFASRMAVPGEESAELVTWPEGNGRLIDHLRQQIGPRIRTGAAVTDILPGAEHARIEVRVLDVATQKIDVYLARQVIFSAPMFLARHLIRPLREERPAWLEAFQHSPWMVANLTLRDRPFSRGYFPAWDNVIYDSPSLGYVSATHQSLRDYGPTVWTYYLPLSDADVTAARRRLLEASWQEWADVVVTDLTRAHPDLKKQLARIDVMRWGHAMIRPVPGFIWGPDRRRAQEPFRGIHFAHTDLSGMALFEEANDHGIRAAEAVLEALGRPSPSIRA